MAIGGTGVVSVAANIIPDKISTMTAEFLDRDSEGAKKIHFEILDLCKAMFIETNPIPVKTSLKLMGMLNGEMRLPLCEMQKENEEKLKKVLKQYKLI